MHLIALRDEIKEEEEKNSRIYGGCVMAGIFSFFFVVVVERHFFFSVVAVAMRFSRSNDTYKVCINLSSLEMRP